MPKATRTKLNHRNLSATKRQLPVAVDSEATQDHPEVGENLDSGNLDVTEDILKHVKKKEKQAMKHELFIQRLESGRTPYSKSHERRLKRKAKEQVAGGFDDMQVAISLLAGDAPNEETDGTTTQTQSQSAATKPRAGLIGEGKSTTLSKAQRKRALQAERLRVPVILSNPSFSSNPFQTIRIHAKNTLEEHQIPE
ncbi:ribosome biogenesis protein SLX9-domain-containing protein [Abortiporus biennis]|nr:ribosome biogenesis protein SLX9-domain-containing protein [Abortiporus biennis]